MKNFIYLAVIAAVAIIAYLALAPKQSSAPQSSAEEVVSGAIERSAEETAVDPQVAEAVASQNTTAPENADVFILEPGNGSVVSSPVTVKFGITNMSVAPAGTLEENSGHHHLLIDMDELPPLDQPLPATEQLIHFGAGQTETTIELAPGEHTLQLVLGNHLHVPHNPAVISKKITIVVE